MSPDGGMGEPCVNVTPAAVLRRERFDVVYVTEPVKDLLDQRELVHVTNVNEDLFDPDPKASFLGGPMLDRDVGITRRGERLDVVGVGADHWSEQLVHAKAPTGAGFEPLVAVGPAAGKGRVTSGVSAASWDDNRVDVVAVGELAGRRGLLHWWAAYDEPLNGPELLPCGLADRTPALVTTGVGELHAFGVDVDGRLWHWHCAGGAFQGPFEVAPDVSGGGLGAVARADGEVHVAGISKQHKLVHARRDTAGAWDLRLPSAPARLTDHRPALAMWGPDGQQVLHASLRVEPGRYRMGPAVYVEEARAWSPVDEPVLADQPGLRVTEDSTSAMVGNEAVLLHFYRLLSKSAFSFLDENVHKLAAVAYDLRRASSPVPDLARPARPVPEVSLSEWVWRLTVESAASWFVVHLGAHGTVAEWTDQVLGQADLLAWERFPVEGEDPFCARLLLDSQGRHTLQAGIAYSYVAGVRGRGVLPAGMFGVISGPRPEPELEPLLVTCWLVNQSAPNRYGEVQRGVSEPVQFTVPPRGAEYLAVRPDSRVPVVDLQSNGLSRQARVVLPRQGPQPILGGVFADQLRRAGVSPQDPTPE